ncbi:phenazine biosynthesis protein PhzF family [Janthinobacterium psychrotolerans]|uniref:Phenazine biosynthesis protein PhzF family n=2 Tax=Janthinobacterium psychrotolerans TaxID=1747903 RepID=A0A1A7C205_9BURK|nr:PhzF family phenazine biosynthesis protein [Janthinobacterium psychrotolerans]OBV39767.1 phenazine biosynthesis protein PhzF family [Janthinobacterium psychrotolerans]
MTRRFKQIDVFTSVPLKGNPLAVILDADGLGDEQMQSIARWTNLSETTFVLPASDPAADYRVRIFTTQEEFPFAGHPTLGTAHALLEAGLQPKTPGVLVQQCGIGLVPVRMAANGEHGALGFRAPPAQLDAMEIGLLPLLQATLGIGSLPAQHPPVVANMGICWLVVRLASAADCLAVVPDGVALAELMRRSASDGVAIYGAHAAGGPAGLEVRAFTVENGMLLEDPVTGSANACIARLLPGQDYRVRQGTAIGRDGRVTVVHDADGPWICGQSVTIIDGTLTC